MARLGRERPRRGPRAAGCGRLRLPHSRPPRRARAARPHGALGTDGRVRLRHADAGHGRDVDRRPSSGRRGADRRGPRPRGSPRRVRLLPPARAPRDAGRVRRLLLPEQLGGRRPAPARPRSRPRRGARRRRPPRKRCPVDLLGTGGRAHGLGSRRPGRRLVPPFPRLRRRARRGCRRRHERERAAPAGVGRRRVAGRRGRARRRRTTTRERGARRPARGRRRRRRSRTHRSRSPRTASARPGRRLGALALPTVLVQEGGYDLETLGPLVRAVLEGFEDA